MNIAIIPARGGSKRIPRKNLRDFCGKPIIAWSIEAAVTSGLFDQVIVSTDCASIAAVSTAHGASTPFVRPPELSDDFTPTLPVIRHAINWLSAEQRTPENVCCLYATAPFVTSSDLKRGLDSLLSEPKLDFAFSVTHFPFPIQRALTLRDGHVQMLQPEYELTRSQDLSETFHDAGQFYWGRADSFAAHDRIYSANSAPVMIPCHRVQDIDTPEDWTRAECMYRAIQSQEEAA
ncbi:MAG: pseudaminic acid cytidylyltransferase [Pirellulaceae bacterium]|nr:pseudaminic acid cytidylyltransferase [Pirellulaceae bacterium]